MLLRDCIAQSYTRTHMHIHSTPSHAHTCTHTQTEMYSIIASCSCLFFLSYASECSRSLDSVTGVGSSGVFSILLTGTLYIQVIYSLSHTQGIITRSRTHKHSIELNMYMATHSQQSDICTHSYQHSHLQIKTYTLTIMCNYLVCQE